jgi:uncharacterized membrane protein (UPF0127 family)
MLRASLPEGDGIVLRPCNSVHMALMRFAIDVAYLDRQDRITKMVHELRPYRVSFGGRAAYTTVELPAGTLKRMNVRIGDYLLIVRGVGAAAGPKVET